MSASLPPEPSRDETGPAATQHAATQPGGGGPSSPQRDVSRPAPVASEHLLPPVEPPSGAFLLQLFVIPAVIVAIVVGIWLLINSLVNRGAHDPQAIVRSLRGSSQARFQKAMELADMLRMERQYPQLKTNAELAQALAEMLDEMREAGDDAESAVTMRWIVCGALGQFRVDDGLDALLRAATSDPDRDVRRKAIGAIATLAQTFAERDPPQPLEHPELTDTLVELANQPDDDLIRSETAFALGVLASVPGADGRYEQELELMLEDFFPDARYNSAVGLARRGDLRAIPTLVEMLDLESIQTSMAGEEAFSVQVSEQSLARQRGEKRDLVLINGLKGVDSLHSHHPEESFARLEAAIDKLLAEAPTVTEPTSIPPSLLEAARQVQARIKS